MTRSSETVWPPQSHVEIGEWSVGDVRPGDLVFSSKAYNADRIEILNQIAGQQWRHVAAVIERDGDLHVVEIDKNSFGFRSLADFMSAFDRYGAARLGLSPDCVTAASIWMETQIDSDHFYAWDDLILAGLLSLTTRGLFVKSRTRVRAALHAAFEAAKEAQLANFVDSYTCSGFIQAAYEKAGCAIIHERWRRAESWPPRLNALDDLLSGDDIAMEEIFGGASLLELHELVESRERGDDWRPTGGQIAEMVRVLRAAISGVASGEEPEELRTDGRWVTPSDLWTSPSLRARGSLPGPT